MADHLMGQIHLTYGTMEGRPVIDLPVNGAMNGHSSKMLPSDFCSIGTKMGDFPF